MAGELAIAGAAKGWIDYKLVKGYEAECFRAECVKALQDGWIPLAGVFVAVEGIHSSSTLYAQAFVK